MKLQKFYLPFCITIMVFSACTFPNSEHNYITLYERNKAVFDEMITYIDSTISKRYKNQKTVRKTVLFCFGRDKFDDADYRMCDNYLEDKMKTFEFTSIEILEGGCKDGVKFDLIMFELSQKGIDTDNYYIRYSSCDLYSDNVETTNIKNISLAKNWSLFIEKN